MFSFFVINDSDILAGDKENKIKLIVPYSHSAGLGFAIVEKHRVSALSS